MDNVEQFLRDNLKGLSLEQLLKVGDNFEEVLSQYTRKNSQPSWKINREHFFGYNETTLSLTTHESGNSYILRTPNYPYRESVTTRAYSNNRKRKFSQRGNRLLHELTQGEDCINSLERELETLPAVKCTSSDPHDEYEELLEKQRFHDRADLVIPHVDEKGYVHTHFNFLADINRNLWYHAQEILNPVDDDCDDVYLDIDQTRQLITEICKDFDIPFPRHTKLVKKFRNPKAQGLYNPQTTDIFLLNESQGVKKHNILHEMAHHIADTFGPERPLMSPAHGFRFKKIHMHLAYKYGDVPFEMIMDCGDLQHAYCPSFPIREHDITGRDFNETRSVELKSNVLTPV